MIKWFWRFLQHISAPSEKEIRESLIRLSVLVCLLLGTGAQASEVDEYLKFFDMEGLTWNEINTEFKKESKGWYDNYINSEMRRLAAAVIVHKGTYTAQKGEFPQEALLEYKKRMENEIKGARVHFAITPGSREITIRLRSK